MPTPVLVVARWGIDTVDVGLVKSIRRSRSGKLLLGDQTRKGGGFP